jgi:hypothetical protein
MLLLIENDFTEDETAQLALEASYFEFLNNAVKVSHDVAYAANGMRMAL